MLAVETSGRSGSVALGLGDDILAETRFSGQMRHSAELFPAIDSLLERFKYKTEQIQHVYISAGPGSFTGLRIAVTVAKIIHLACRADIVAVNTLDMLAENARPLAEKGVISSESGHLGVIIDAKRGEFFVGLFDWHDGKWQKAEPDELLSASEFVSRHGCRAGSISLLGEGLVFYADKFKADNICILDEKYWSGRAVNVFAVGRRMAKAGEFVEARALVPNYLRKPLAVKKAQS